MLLVPYRRESFLRELLYLGEWYNDVRPHTTLSGRTPNEVYACNFPRIANRVSSPAQGWPRGSPCARPWALVKGKPVREPGSPGQTTSKAENTCLSLRSSRRHWRRGSKSPSPSGEGTRLGPVDHNPLGSAFTTSCLHQR